MVLSNAANEAARLARARAHGVEGAPRPAGVTAAVNESSATATSSGGGAKPDLAQDNPGWHRAAASPAAAPTANKPSNPKDALGILKLALSVFPLPVLWEACIGMLEGGLKYGRHNYRVIGVRGSVYFDATFRHLSSWWEGEDLDPDSGIHHISKAITSLVVLRDSMIRGNWVDDRPPKSDPQLVADMNKRVRALLAKYPEPVEPYTEIAVTAAVAGATGAEVHHAPTQKNQ